MTLAALPPFLSAEFFKYTDETGQSVYVDDVSKIPPQFRSQSDAYADEEDHLDPAEKMALDAQKERERALRQTRREQALDLNRQKALQQAQTARTSDPLPDIPHSRGATQVLIANGQVVVPVQFRHKGKRVSASLLLDTGANTTLISQSVGDQLGLAEGGRTVGIQVVGGAVIPGRHIPVDEMTVGPHKKRNMPVIVIENGGVGDHDGLLGMDFLMGIRFHVDYERQRLVWSG